MNKNDLINAKIGDVVTQPGFQAMIIYLTENAPKPSAPLRDATTIINDEGVVQGYLKCLEMIRTIHITPKPPEKKEIQNYSEPK